MYCYYIHLLHEKNEVDSFSDLPKITHLVNGRTCIQILFSLTSESRLCSSKNNFSLSAFSSHPESLASQKAFTVKLQSEIFVSQGFFFLTSHLPGPLPISPVPPSHSALLITPCLTYTLNVGEDQSSVFGLLPFSINPYFLGSLIQLRAFK